MAFADNPKKINLSCGEEIILPRMTIGKILSVTHAFSELVKAAKKEFPELIDNPDKWEKDPAGAGVLILKSLPDMLPVLGDQVIDVVATYVGKDQDWVKDNMDLEDLTKVAVPFLEAFMRQGNHLVGTFNQMFVQKPSNSSKQTSSTPLQS